MIRVRPSADRGRFDHGWLDTRHTFSFGAYHDPAHVRFRALRVINEDVIQPAQGFGTHPHADMEILTVVLSGSLAHRDSLGTLRTLGPGEVQRMTAGTGITHSEFNASTSEPVHLYQVWLFPRERGLPPAYDQRGFPEAGRRNRLQPVATPDGAGSSLTIAQDARVFLANVDAGHAVRHALAPGRHAWLQVLRGRVALNGTPLEAGDGAAVSDEPSLTLAAAPHSDAPAELMLFDLA